MSGCALLPAGWLCTRTPGHEGPCAAMPKNDAESPDRLITALMMRIERLEERCADYRAEREAARDAKDAMHRTMADLAKRAERAEQEVTRLAEASVAWAINAEKFRARVAELECLLHASEDHSKVILRDAIDPDGQWWKNRAEKAEAQRDRLKEALGPDAADRDFADLLADSADHFSNGGGGPLGDCLRLKSIQVRTALAEVDG